MLSLKQLRGFIKWYYSEYINKNSVGDVYTSLSHRGYDDIVGFERRTSALKKLVSRNNFKNSAVLDLACGTGAFIQAVIDHKPKRTVGVDLTAGMLEVAKKRFKHFKNISFIHQSFMNVHFPKGTFDYILLANASRYIPFGEEKTFFSNVHSWLKPNGVFIILSDNVFGYSTFGRILSKLIYGRNIAGKINPNTTADWALKQTLSTYFRIVRSEKVQEVFHMKHKAFFCQRIKR